MPTSGNRKNPAKFAEGYETHPMYEFARAYMDTLQSITRESAIDTLLHPIDSLLANKEALRNFFVKDSCYAEQMTAAELEDHNNSMNALFENDVEGILEYAPAASFNPVVGMSMPLHKNLLMNGIFDNGVISKYVAERPTITVSMEVRKLVTVGGKELDMWKDQLELSDAIRQSAPVVKVPIALPEFETTDILRDVFHATNLYDNLSIATYVSDVLVRSMVEEGDMIVDYTPPVIASDGTVTTPAVFTERAAEAADITDAQYVWKEINGQFGPAYGEYNRSIMYPVKVRVMTKAPDATAGTPAVYGETTDVIAGYMKKNKFMIQTSGNVVAIRMAARIDTASAMVQTPSFKWEEYTTPIEIADAIPINVTISPNEVKDIGALYGINQFTKVMSMIDLGLKNLKDDGIHDELDNSFLRLPENQKIARTFDFVPRESYADTHIEWREKTFMDALDDYTECLFQYLNDPNMTISVVGRPALIKKIVPKKDYTYQTPPNIGPVKLNFVKTVVNEQDFVYQFVSTDKMRGNDNLIIILNPRNTDRIMYRIYDYQTYVSNEVRNSVNYALPAIHAFERWKFFEYQPVQGRVKILNPSGLKEHYPNTDPIGKRAMNDLEVTP